MKQMKNADSNYDIIDDILSSQEKAFEGEQGTKKVAHITSANFFTQENVGGPIIKDEWLKVIHEMSKPELGSFKAFLEKLSENENIHFSPIVRPDEDGRNHLWVTFKYKKGNQVFKVFTTKQTCKFLVMYQAGLLTVDLSLEELYAEAKK